MPVSKLYVEGNLDSEIYAALFAGVPPVVRGGSKNSLRPQARNDRNSGIQAGYLRDRDFDFDPPEDMDCPTVDVADAQEPWGWRLNRHEIENYLLDPQVIEGKFGIAAHVWRRTLCGAARRIRWYQIARWTVGYARSKLPPHYKLQTKPDDVRDLRLPRDLSEQASLDWCRGTIAEFRAMIDRCLCDSAVSEQIERRRERFSDELLDDALHVVQWCSGKDLFAALTDEDLQNVRVQDPQTLCNILRDFVRDHSDDLLGFFPEFAALKHQIAGPGPERNSDAETLSPPQLTTDQYHDRL
jgi:hypothetical protein